MARRASADIVVPVYNSLHHVRVCLESVRANATPPYHLYVINDASDEYTSRKVEGILGAHGGHATLTAHHDNQGYLRSVNEGIGKGAGEIVVLLNSDAALSPGVLERVEAGFASDPHVGIINAVSTWANWTRIPFPAGTNTLTLNERVQELGEDALADIGNASGFFFAARRKLFQDFGLFDEAYHPGYWEEADFCMRVLAAGYRVVVDRKLYVFHHGWGSFEKQGRDAHMARNRSVFMSRWQDKYAKIEKRWRANNPVEALSARISNVPEVFGTHRLRVRYLVPAMYLYDVTLVVQLVNRLINLGIDANVVVIGEVEKPLSQQMPMYFQPYVLSSHDLFDRFPACDVIMATHWSTVYPAVHLASQRVGVRLAYFVQDFEPTFYPERSDEFRAAERTYRMIEHKIVSSLWLVDRLAVYGGAVHHIPRGVNLDVFYPRAEGRRPRLVSLAGPGSTQRNWPMIKAVYNELARRRPDIELALFGSGYSTLEIEDSVYDYGELQRATDVADMLNECTAFLDCGAFQESGYLGLEAMACGTAVVLSCENDNTVYAKHLYNSLLIEPNERAQIVASIERVFDDVGRRDQLIAQGLRTVKDYCHRDSAYRTMQLLQGLTRTPDAISCGSSP